MISTLLRRPHRTTRHSALGIALVGTLAAACGGSDSIQEQAGAAVNAYIADDEALSDADFDEDCVERTANGLTDDVARDVVDDNGRVDFDVDDRDRDDVYDFYNCADERDLARVIEDDLGAEVSSASCFEALFDDRGASEVLNERDGDDPARLGDFDNLATGECGDECCEPVPPPEPPPSTVPATTVPPETTSTTSTTTTTTTTTTSTPPTTTPAQPMPGGSDSTPDEYAVQSADFLNNDLAVSDAVGGDVSGVVCTPPSRTAVGTNYLCVGEAAGFGPIEFTVEIDALDSFLVTDFRAAASIAKTTFVDALVVGLTAEDLLVDQVCVRDVVDGLPEDEVQIVVDNIDAPTFPGGLSFDENALTTLLIGCVSA